MLALFILPWWSWLWWSGSWRLLCWRARLVVLGGSWRLWLMTGLSLVSVSSLAIWRSPSLVGVLLPYHVRVPLIFRWFGFLARWLGERTLPDTPVCHLDPFIGIAILPHWTRARLMALHLPVPLAYTLGVAATFIVCILSLWCHFALPCRRLLLHLPRLLWLLFLTLCWRVTLVLASCHFLLGAAHLVFILIPSSFTFRAFLIFLISSKLFFFFLLLLFLLLILFLFYFFFFVIIFIFFFLSLSRSLRIFPLCMLLFLVFIFSVLLRCFLLIRLLRGSSAIWTFFFFGMDLWW